MTKVLTTLKNFFTIEVLRTRLLYTLGFVAIARLGTFIILPGIDPTYFNREVTGILALLDNLVMLGSSFRSRSIFALGIYPYISASIIVQVASLTIPYFQRLQKEGPSGRSKLSEIIRFLTLAIAPLQAIPYVLSNSVQSNILLMPKAYFFVIAVILLCTGTLCCVWLADRITEKGIGNGSSILIMASIVSSLPGALWVEMRARSTSQMLFFALELAILFILILVIITFIQGVRRIPLQYARQLGSYMLSGYGGVRQYLPIKMNGPGVMPIIFAQTLSTLPIMIANLFRTRSEVAANIVRVMSNYAGWELNLLLAILIFMATFFYTAIFVNPHEIADELKRNNGFISGVNPGKPTALYIDGILSKLTLPGALFLAFVTILPAVADKAGVTKEFSKFYGGTSLLILVGVILEIINQIESYLAMRYYDRMVHTSQANIDHL